MTRTEFIHLLKYYFRHSDKSDLKGILEDCEAEFRKGAKKGLSEEEICCHLGHPKNIYRYYMGLPIVPEDNPRMPGEDADYGYDEQPRRSVPYDWEKEPDRIRHHTASEAYYRQPPRYDTADTDIYDSHDDYPRQRSNTTHRRRPSRDDVWEESHAEHRAANAITSSLLDIAGVLCSLVGGLLFFAFVIALLCCVIYEGLGVTHFFAPLPLPQISLSTMAYGVLSILFASLTASYAGDACTKAAKRRRNE